ncbi:MAG: FtsW/RodA/SpoVE family cell cycle protein [Planctomycetota bacterium]
MLRMSHGVVLCALTLLVMGIVMVNSAGLSVRPDPALLNSGVLTPEQFAEAEARYAPISFEQIFFGRTTILAVLSLGAMWFGYRMNLERLFTRRGATSPIPWLLAAIVITLVLVFVPPFGREVKGSARWIGPPSYGFQPSELAKWGMLLVIAWFCVRHADRLASFKRGFLPAIGVVGLVCALIGKEDLGTAALVFTTCTLLLVVGGIRWWHAGLLVPAGALAAAGAIIANPYRVDRILAWRNPWADAEGIGYHIIQSMSAISGGGLAGRGLGNSLQKFGYLPEDTTDFIYAIICEEIGIVGALFVVTLYAAMLLCGLAIVTRGARRPEADSIVPPFSRLVGIGVLLTIGIQAFINLAVVTGLAPTKGIALPLLSSGGTGWVMTGFSLGLLLSIERNAIARERELGIVDEPPGRPTVHRSVGEAAAAEPGAVTT